jgi:hypothetical protein
MFRAALLGLLLPGAVLAAPTLTPTRTPTPFLGTNTRAIYRLNWITRSDPFLGVVRLPDFGDDAKLTPDRCPGLKWWVDDRGGKVFVEAPAALHTALSAEFVRADGWYRYLAGLSDIFAPPAFAFGGDHFTVDSSASYTPQFDTLQGTWTFGTGSTVTLTGGTGDCRQMKTGENSTNTIVHARGKTSNDGTGPFGSFVNWVLEDFYLSYATSNTWKIYVKDVMYTQLATASSTINNDQYYVTKFESLTDGANKILTLSVDGVTMTGPVTTAVLLGSGGYGVDGNASSGSTITWDWLIADPAIALTTFDRKVVPPGASLILTGTGFGNGYVAQGGGRSFGSVANTGSVSLTMTAPTAVVGVLPVTVKFGTAGSEEFSGSLAQAVNIFTGSGIYDRRP